MNTDFPQRVARAVVALTISLLGLASSNSAYGKSYSFTTLKVPGAACSQGENCIAATGINDNGQIVGWYFDSNQDQHGFLFSGGTFSTREPVGARHSAAYGINNAGDIVGEYEDSNGVLHGFLLYSSGASIDIDFPGEKYTTPMGINDADEVVGSIYDGTAFHGFLFNGAFTAIDFPGAGASGTMLTDSRRGRNTQVPFADLLRQSVYSRLAGYEDLNDAERLSQDPTFRLIGSERIWDRGAALTSCLQSFETEMLAQEENFAGLARLNRALIAKAEALDSGCRTILDMDSTEVPVYGEQEQSAYNGYFESTCFHPLLLFNEEGDCLAANPAERDRQRAQRRGLGRALVARDRAAATDGEGGRLPG